MMIQEVNISFSILKVSSHTTTMLAIEVKFSLMLLVGLDWIYLQIFTQCF